MRILHTADWHLGRIFHGVHLTADQAFVLDRVVRLVSESKPDVVLVSGDVYDRAVPPPDAVALLDDTLSRLVLGLRIPVILIAGNHDSPERLSFGSKVLAPQHLHLAGTPAPDAMPVVIHDRHGPVSFCSLPYAEPALVRERLDRKDVVDHDSAMAAQIESARRPLPAGGRAVLVAHAFVAGGIESESERSLSVGGAAAVGVEHFDGFHYAALGHLHRPQRAGADHVQYAGSLLCYSFAEAGQTKSVNLVELDAAGRCAVERIPLAPRHEVRCIRGAFRELLAGPQAAESREDYVMAVLTDKEPILDAHGRLSEIYPNLLHIERSHLAAAGETGGAARDHRRLSDLELFRAFFSQVTGDELTPEQAEAYAEIVENLRRAEREAD